MPGMIKFKGEVEREARTRRDYKEEYKGLEPQDFVRIHEQDLQALLDLIPMVRCIDATDSGDVLEYGRDYPLALDAGEYYNIVLPDGRVSEGWDTSRFSTIRKKRR